MACNDQLSVGSASALVALPQGFQDVQVTMQVKEHLGGWCLFAVSDGAHWTPVMFTLNFRDKLSGLHGLGLMRIVTITRVYIFKSCGWVSSHRGL